MGTFCGTLYPLNRHMHPKIRIYDIPLLHCTSKAKSILFPCLFLITTLILILRSALRIMARTSLVSLPSASAGYILQPDITLYIIFIYLYHRSYHYGAHIVRTLCFSCRGLHKMHTSTKYIAGLVFANRSKKICIYNIHSQLKVNLKLFWCQHHYKGVLSTAYPIYLELRVFLRET